jgi:hypothetical protein
LFFGSQSLFSFGPPTLSTPLGISDLPSILSFPHHPSSQEAIMSLLHRPVEIIILIAKWLQEKNRTLASLAACNQLLRDIVTPVLYSDINLNPNYDIVDTVIDLWTPHSIRVS